ncbi:MAG: sulfate/molybdate ABC transporter ATP-binding protein [Pelatocladus maniniholoensis HA4357-MV3]|jgi:sulfate transport system ATP-binding protein|uniref:ABC-type quaternary amine transporter n=1 Tax=Pelatocladus maniniholoensis HA4357-MV3 TaxID=1117104 RepID=A0A9E3H7S5_9NOST|nr:sulfate/molybdate ABC transporter ATP-binding protein [Pelatocladus maniniholoensis HA4357-MV3]BAZ65622.1 sulfate ABC transporter ATPase [Fischerella sp. NIES-4106]
MGIAVENVSKHYGSFHAVDDVSLEIKTGSLVALLGPSGSGKSTLLRMIAGLEIPDAGQIWLVGENATHRSVQERNIGFVFQHYALFKHLTVRENIAFAMELRKANKHRTRQRVEELLELVQLTGFGDRYPSQLSGGQRQRVALARALAVQPRILLLDEPFGALDAKVRKDLRTWLRNLHSEVHVTTVFVTHDQEEAMEVADEIVVMNQGRVEQVGSPAYIYDNPATPFVMSFIGPVNVLPGNAGIAPNRGTVSPTDKVFLRPHDVLIAIEASDDTTSVIVDRIIHLGWEIRAELALQSGERINAFLSREQFRQLDLQEGQRVYVKPKQAKVFSGAYVIT